MKYEAAACGRLPQIDFQGDVGSAAQLLGGQQVAEPVAVEVDHFSHLAEGRQRGLIRRRIAVTHAFRSSNSDERQRLGANPVKNEQVAQLVAIEVDPGKLRRFQPSG